MVWGQVGFGIGLPCAPPEVCGLAALSARFSLTGGPKVWVMVMATVTLVRVGSCTGRRTALPGIFLSPAVRNANPGVLVRRGKKETNLFLVTQLSSAPCRNDPVKRLIGKDVRRRCWIEGEIGTGFDAKTTTAAAETRTTTIGGTG